MATDTMYEFMGVRVDPVNEAVKGDVAKLTAAVPMAGKVAVATAGYSLDGRLNDSFKAVNLLLEKGVRVRRVDKPDQGLRAGDFLVGAGAASTLADIARETGVDFAPLPGPVPPNTHEIARPRVAMYQRYGGGNIDEGWTRWLLEDFKFPYTSLFDAEIKKGNLNEKYDAIVIPEDSTATITGDRPAPEEVCQNLNEKQRRRFLLAIREGKSNSEIAEVEGVERPAIIDGFRRMARKNAYVRIWLSHKNKVNQHA